VRIEPKRNLSAPSTKNGRFSSKNVSKAVRFTTAGSTSTCPKSGSTVAFRVRSLVTPYLRSTPAAPNGSLPSRNGLPLSTCTNSIRPEV
jgi:hypothetical protein